MSKSKLPEYHFIQNNPYGIKVGLKGAEGALYNDKRYSVSTKKIRHLGWTPKYNLLKDLPKIIEWYKDNLTIYKNCK